MVTIKPIRHSSSGNRCGCPFALGAAGNLATALLIAFLHEMGMETGIDLHAIALATRFLESKLGRPLKAPTAVPP